MPLPAGRFSRVTGVRNETGLTLIEVLISLSLMALILGVLSQFLYSGVRVQNKNAQAYERQYLLKSLYQVFSSDLAALTAGPYLPEKAFLGKEYELSFWREDSAGLVQIKYRYSLPEKKLYKSIGFWGSAPEETVLFEGLTDWKFQYYQAKNKNWLLEWDPDLKEETPRLISISFKTGGKDFQKIVLPVRVGWSMDNNHEI